AVFGVAVVAGALFAGGADAVAADRAVGRAAPDVLARVAGAVAADGAGRAGVAVGGAGARGLGAVAEAVAAEPAVPIAVVGVFLTQKWIEAAEAVSAIPLVVAVGLADLAPTADPVAALPAVRVA